MEEKIRKKMKGVVDKHDQVIVLSTLKKGLHIYWDTKDIEHLKSLLRTGLEYIEKRYAGA